MDYRTVIVPLVNDPSLALVMAFPHVPIGSPPLRSADCTAFVSHWSSDIGRTRFQCICLPVALQQIIDYPASTKEAGIEPSLTT